MYHCHCGSPVEVLDLVCPVCGCGDGAEDCGKRYSVKSGDLVTRKRGDTAEILLVTMRADDGRVYVAPWIRPMDTPAKLEPTSIAVYHIG